jgi:hypothetical protein
MAAYLMSGISSTLSGQQQGQVHSYQHQSQQQQQQQQGLKDMLQQCQLPTHQLPMSQPLEQKQGATLCKLKLTTS